MATKKAAPKSKTTAKKIEKPAAKKVVKVAAKKLEGAASEKLTATLKIGDKMPAFSLPTDAHGVVSLKDYLGTKRVVVYFYPRDNTPGCTTQACAFQASSKKLKSAEAVVIGISPDSIESHAKFRTKFELEFILASDVDHKYAEKCGVWAMKQNYGKSYMGIVRTTFVVGKDGVITHIWPKVAVKGHDEAVLSALSGDL